MGAVSLSDCKVKRSCPDFGLVKLLIQTPNTTDTDDTIAVTLSDYGIMATGLLAVKGWVATTEASVLVGEAPTTSVTTGTLTITVGGTTASDYVRVYEVVGRSSST